MGPLGAADHVHVVVHVLALGAQGDAEQPEAVAAAGVADDVSHIHARPSAANTLKTFFVITKWLI